MVTSTPNLHTIQPYPIPEFRVIQDGRSLALTIQAISQTQIAGVDTETTGRDPLQHRLRLVQLAVPQHPVLVIDLFAIPANKLAPLKSFLSDPNILKVGHYLKFDYQFLNRAGLTLAGKFFDTFLAYRALTAGLKTSLKLSALAERLLCQVLDKTQQRSDFSGQLSRSQLGYAATDAAVVLDLKRVLEANLQQDRRLWRTAQLEFRCIEAVAHMELVGIQVDLSQWQEYGIKLKQQQQTLLTKIAQLQRSSQQLSLIPELTHAINPHSPKQVLQALQNIGAPIRSTNEKELVAIADQFPIVNSLLEYRRITKLATVFETSLPQHIHPQTGRIHAQWNQYGARSGRFTCKEPALQTIPRTQAARRCFVAAPGYKLIKADYSQFELRIVARLSGDRRLQEAYLQGEDIHRLTASLILQKSLLEVSEGDRRLAKSVNFGLIYGMGAARLQTYAQVEYGIVMSIAEARLFIKRFFQAYPGIKKWHRQIQQQVYAHDLREFYTLFGRRRRWANKPRLTEVLNHPVQGLNADIIKIVLIKLHKPLKRLGARIVGIIHDELLVECPEAECDRAMQLIRQFMTKAARQFLEPIPVVVELSAAESWGGNLGRSPECTF